MSMKIVIDMNLSIEWITILEDAGFTAVHWSQIGNPCAEDAEIMTWSGANGYVVFTHDLDFGTTLALTHAGGPSVIQVRGHRILPEQMGSMVLETIKKYEGEIITGALVVVEQLRSRVRILPL